MQHLTVGKSSGGQMTEARRRRRRSAAQFAIARRNWARTYVAGKSRDRWSFMRYWTRAQVLPCSGARGSSVAAPSMLSGGQGAVQAAATKWRHHYACANWCGPARSRGGACRAIIANSSSAAALRRKPLLGNAAPALFCPFQQLRMKHSIWNMLCSQFWL